MWRRARRLAILTAALGAAAPAAYADALGQPAPAFALAQRGAAAPLSLDSLRGRVVMVNFWASWCGPCRDEFPLLDQMYRKYRGAGFTLLGVDVDAQPADAEGFLARTPVSFPILLDSAGQVSALYRVQGMPSTLLIDRRGVLRWVHRGYQSGDENEYLDQIRSLLREK